MLPCRSTSIAASLRGDAPPCGGVMLPCTCTSSVPHCGVVPQRNEESSCSILCLLFADGACLLSTWALDPTTHPSVQSHARSRTEISARTGVQRGEQEPGNTQSAHSNMGRHEGAQGVTNWETQERGIAEIADEAVLVRRLARGAHGAASSEPPNARGSWDGACSGSSRSVLPRAASDAPTSTTTGCNRPRSSRRRSGVSLSGCTWRGSDIAARGRGCGFRRIVVKTLGKWPASTGITSIEWKNEHEAGVAEVDVGGCRSCRRTSSRCGRSAPRE